MKTLLQFGMLALAFLCCRLCGCSASQVTLDYEQRTRHSTTDPVPDDVVSVRARLLRLADYDPETLRNTILRRYTAYFEVVSGTVPTHGRANRIRLHILDPLIGSNIIPNEIVTFRFLPDGLLVDLAEFPPGIDLRDLWRNPDDVQQFRDWLRDRNRGR